VVRVLRRRRRELVVSGVVTVANDPRIWRVPLDLLERVRALDVQAPKQQVVLRRAGLSLNEQITYEGPTWLDDVLPVGDSGFPHDVTHSVPRTCGKLRGAQAVTTDSRSALPRQLANHGSHGTLR